MNILKLICVFMALAYVVWQLRQIQLGRATRNWRITKGKVIRSYADEHVSIDGRGAHRYSYSANVVYTYHVGDRQFESTHLTYEPTTELSEDAVTELLDGITAGAEVDVIYNPINWEQAVLIPGSSSGNILQLMVSIALLALVIWGVFFATR